MNVKVYPIKNKWRKFKPFLSHPSVKKVENTVLQFIHPEYRSGRHIPREAGWTIDAAWPRSRTGATAYQCFGHCHSIAPIMLQLVRLAEPKRTWCIYSALEHTVVIEREDYHHSTNYFHVPKRILDINLANDDDEAIVSHFEDKIASQDFLIYHTIDCFIKENLIRDGKGIFRAKFPMRPHITNWEPEENSSQHYGT